MLKKTITYTDYNDVERVENFYFNLTKAEIVEMDASVTGGMQQLLPHGSAHQQQPCRGQYPV